MSEPKRIPVRHGSTAAVTVIDLENDDLSELEEFSMENEAQADAGFDVASGVMDPARQADADRICAMFAGMAEARSADDSELTNEDLSAYAPVRSED